jgi:hypothetical protein
VLGAAGILARAALTGFFRFRLARFGRFGHAELCPPAIIDLTPVSNSLAST